MRKCLPLMMAIMIMRRVVRRITARARPLEEYSARLLHPSLLLLARRRGARRWRVGRRGGRTGGGARRLEIAAKVLEVPPVLLGSQHLGRGGLKLTLHLGREVVLVLRLGKEVLGSGALRVLDALA